MTVELDIKIAVFFNKNGCHPCLPVGKSDAGGKIANVNEVFNIEN
jgi:hypothetical protein